MVTPGMSLSINDIAAEPKVTITDCKANGIYAFLLVRGGQIALLPCQWCQYWQC
jgi:hypothetical protein